MFRFLVLSFSIILLSFSSIHANDICGTGFEHAVRVETVLPHKTLSKEVREIVDEIRIVRRKVNGEYDPEKVDLKLRALESADTLLSNWKQRDLSPNDAFELTRAVALAITNENPDIRSRAISITVELLQNPQASSGRQDLEPAFKVLLLSSLSRVNVETGDLEALTPQLQEWADRHTNGEMDKDIRDEKKRIEGITGSSIDNVKDVRELKPLLNMQAWKLMPDLARQVLERRERDD